jgi:hypothetical protein
MDFDTAQGLKGRVVRDPAGEEVGRVGDVLLDTYEDQPAWVRVKTGRLLGKEHLVPLDGLTEDGEDLRCRWPAELVHGAHAAAVTVRPTPEQDADLRGHFKLDLLDPVGPAGGVEVTRFEEEAVVTGEAERVPTERVVVRKQTVTELEKRTVPVRKEVVQLETDPLPEGRVESVEPLDDEVR